LCGHFQLADLILAEEPGRRFLGIERCAGRFPLWNSCPGPPPAHSLMEQGEFGRQKSPPGMITRRAADETSRRSPITDIRV
jgi:hypothetical protein